MNERMHEQERFEQEKREQRRLRTQARYDNRHFGQSARSEPERTANLGPGDPASSAPDAGRTQSGVSDRPTIHALNRQYCGKDKPTDVLSFPLADEIQPFLLGDVAISIDTAARQAQRRGHPLQEELQSY